MSPSGRVNEAHFLGGPVGGDDAFPDNRPWIGLVGREPLADGGPGRTGGLERVEGAEWGSSGPSGKVDERLPEAVPQE